MTSFTTINDPVNKGATKTDTFRTEAEAQARIVELHGMGLTDAFYIDDDETAVDGVCCFQASQHWTADHVAKTVTFDKSSYDTHRLNKAFKQLRRERDTKLDATDWWVTRGSITETQTNYRQALRDLPANTADPTDITWPEEPGS